jgi:DNA primase
MTGLTVDEIKDCVDIVEVAYFFTRNSDVRMVKHGHNYKTSCPFHYDEGQNFWIFEDGPEKQTWKCVGSCDTGGDVFSLVQGVTGYTFPEALHTLYHIAVAGKGVLYDTLSPEEGSRGYYINKYKQIQNETTLIWTAGVEEA